MTCRDPDVLRLRERAAQYQRWAASDHATALHCDDRRGYADNIASAAQHRAESARLTRLAAVAEQRYKREVRLISIGAAQVYAALDADSRTDAIAALVRRHTKGRTKSRTETTAAERAAMLAELKAAGFRPTAKGGRRRGAPSAEQMDRQSMLTRVQQLLTEQRLPWSYAEAILRRQRGITDKAVACPMASATDPELRGVIAALDRRGKRPPAAAQETR
jgi:phage gp16-like protein